MRPSTRTGRSVRRSAIAVASALALTLSAASGAARAQSGSFVWIEGEDAASTTFNGHSWYCCDGIRRDVLSPGVPGGREGDWLAHYDGSSGREVEARYRFDVDTAGTYALWVRGSAYQVAAWIAVDGAPRRVLAMDEDPHEWVNLTAPRPELRYLAWVSAGEVVLAAGPHELVVALGHHPGRNPGEVHGAIDAIALTSAPWGPTGALRPDHAAGLEPAPDAWFPLVAGDDPLDPASITDLRARLHRPAGAHGPARRDGDALRFEDGTPARFWGVGAAIGATPAIMARQARWYAKQGINLVRLHPVQATVGLWRRDPATGARTLDPDGLDRLDRWFAALKAEGIYMAWSVFYPHIVTPDDGYPAELYAELPDAPWPFRPGDGRSSSGVVNVMPALQAAEWAYLSALLGHRNPYTGLRYVEDPALALLEVHNEDSIFWHAPLNVLEAGTEMPRHTAALQAAWQAWLQDRYADDAALHAAWGPVGAGRRAGDSLANARMPIYGAWEMAAEGPARNAAERRRMGDFIRFLAETQRAYYERRGADLRALGYRGVLITTAWQAGGPAAHLANLWTDAALDAIDRHMYVGGGEGGHGIAVGTVDARTHLAQPGTGILARGLEVLADRPFALTEWSQSPPNPWKAEIAPLVAFYGFGLHGWDASMHFMASGPRLGSGWPEENSYVTLTPHYVGQFPALALAVHRGDIALGEVVAARRVDAEAPFAGVDALTQPRPAGGWDGSDGAPLTPPEAFAMGRVTLELDAGEPSRRADWDALWDRASNVVRSTTGELVWDARARVVTVSSPRTQGVVGFAGGGRYALPGATVAVTSPFVSLILTALDDRPIADSGHILVTALARDRQTGARYSPDGSRLESLGGPPLLLEPVQARIELAGAPIESVRAVDPHGVPTDRLVPHDAAAFAIDGRFRAYLYEVRRTPSGPPVTPAPTTAAPTVVPSPAPSVAPPEPTPTAPTPDDPSAGRIYLPALSTGGAGGVGADTRSSAVGAGVGDHGWGQTSPSRDATRARSPRSTTPSRSRSRQGRAGSAGWR